MSETLLDNRIKPVTADDFERLSIRSPRRASVKGFLVGGLAAMGLVYGIGAIDEVTDPSVSAAQNRVSELETSVATGDQLLADALPEDPSCATLMIRYGYRYQGDHAHIGETAAVTDIVDDGACGTSRTDVRTQLDTIRILSGSLQSDRADLEESQAPLEDAERQAATNDIADRTEQALIWGLVSASVIGLVAYPARKDANKAKLESEVAHRIGVVQERYVDVHDTTVASTAQASVVRMSPSDQRLFPSSMRPEASL